MALERGSLANVVNCSIGQTQAAVTCASNKKVYVKSIIVHNPLPAGITSAKAHVYFVPNNGGSAGSATTMNQIFNATVYAEETVLFEPSYPLVLTATGDSVQVGAASSSLNFLITGDKEA